MTLKSVLRALQEVFPQIDLRILRAVAIEYSKDVDAAVEFIISDVLPIINEPVETSYTPSMALDAEQSLNVGEYSHVEDTNEANLLPCHDVIVEQTERVLPSEPQTVESGINLVADYKINVHSETQTSDVIPSGTCSNVLSKDEVLDAKQEEVVNLSKVVNTSQTSAAKFDVPDVNARDLCKTKVDGTLGASPDSDPTLSFQTFQNNLDLMECGEEIKKDMSSLISKYEEQSLVSFKDVSKIQNKCNFEGDSTVLAAFTNTEGIPSVHKISQAQHTSSGESINSEGLQSDFEVQQPGCLAENSSELLPLANESVSVSDKLQTAIIATQGEIGDMDFLNGVILDAQSRKRTLVSALESTIIMLKEVELHEEKAKQAKKEASMDGQDILKRVEDLKQMINRAKVTNDKNAGEIYAEKSTLASETEELQSRLMNLSDEREKSLSIIEEISRTLDARLAAAKEEQAAAEKEKLEKEDMALKILNEQEDIMDSIVQVANRLSKEAEENDKLREFLMDRGRILDILQGEIAAACGDVMSLKNRVHRCMPDKISISSVTSTMISSTSSMSEKSLLSGIVHHPPASESPSIVDKEANDCPLECNVPLDYKEHSDDDWEMLERSG